MTDPSYPDALPAQHRLHWYVLERVLGQGGFGITYLARDTNLDQPVAIKEYLPVEVATRRPDSSVRSRTEDQGERYRWGLDRFIREARTLARFDHPNIVRVHSVFEHNNTAYMVMRFEEGENLAALLERRRTLPEDELMRIVRPILDGLELVHNAGFIHRDIKPDNIHIRADGSPVLLDFGSARHSMGHARTVTILVAPGYAPFEQYYSSGENQGPWTDLYSLGATCYRAISGISPMDAITRSKGILGSTQEILVPAAIIGGGRYSAGLLKAIDHALEFAEKDRPQSIAEWRKELATGGKTDTRAAPAPAAVAPAAATPTPSLRGPLIWATLGAIVAAVVVVAVLLWQQPPRPPTIDPAFTKLQEDYKRSEEARRKLEEQRKKEADDAARRQLEDMQKHEAESRAKAEQDKKIADERARRELEAKKNADAAKARREAEGKKKIDAGRTEARPPVAVAPTAPPPAPAPVKPAEPDLIKQAEEASKRGNDTESLALYRKAANAGIAEGQYRLGEIYAAGRGVNQSNVQAYIWLSLAANAGHAGAKARRDEVAKALQPAEILQADRLVLQRSAKR
jgi:serine/threonine protein kinase